MKQNKFGEMIFDQQDVIDLLMQGRDPAVFDGMLVDDTVAMKKDVDFVDAWPQFVRGEDHSDLAVADWHKIQQKNWHMPEQYKNLDIAEHVLRLCDTEVELQRVGQELLLYQERDLFDLLRYLKYLVDVMKQNQVIWGVGRGSSVASYVLYKLQVHRINSIYYELNVREFLR
jgi:DNA polymerase III alpha subunit